VPRARVWEALEKRSEQERSPKVLTISISDARWSLHNFNEKEGKQMDHAHLEAAVARHTGMSGAEAAKAVQAVLETLRELPDSAMVLRKTPGKTAPLDQRKMVHLCG
jgi:hypothetical protein